MLRYLPSTVVVLLLLACPQGFTQSRGMSASAGAEWVMPAGTLGKRFLPAAGGTAAALWRTSRNWVWGARGHFSAFNRVNSSKMAVTRMVSSGGSTYRVTVPVPGIAMRLSTAAIMLEAGYYLYESQTATILLSGAFGVTRWTFSRNPYDSLAYDTSGTGSGTTVNLIYKAPGSAQQDWSGSLSLGIRGEVVIATRWSLYAEAGYRNILAELWPALAFDMENASSLQFIVLRAGISRQL